MTRPRDPDITTSTTPTGCESCSYCGTDSDGGEPEYVVSWMVCEKPGNEGFNNLKTFPFKKRMKCHLPEFWYTKFAEAVGGSTDRMVNRSMDRAFRLYRLWKEKWKGVQRP